MFDKASINYKMELATLIVQPRTNVGFLFPPEDFLSLEKPHLASSSTRPTLAVLAGTSQLRFTVSYEEL